MAPEQWSHRPVTPRTDIYALGCVAYELLTGKTLFAAKDLFDLMQEKFTARVPQPSEIGGGISAELHAFVAAAVRPNPEERPDSLDVLASWAAPCDSLPESAFAKSAQ
jgi:serine/threonine protein kinase